MKKKIVEHIFFMFCRCRGVVEWFVSLVFDVILLIVEASVNLYLANTLGEEGLTLEYRAIIIMIMLPSLINPCVWLGLKSSYNISRYLYFHMYLVCSEKRSILVIPWFGSVVRSKRPEGLRVRELEKILYVGWAINKSALVSGPTSIYNLHILLKIFPVNVSNIK